MAQGQGEKAGCNSSVPKSHPTSKISPYPAHRAELSVGTACSFETPRAAPASPGTPVSHGARAAVPAGSPGRGSGAI